MSGTVILNIVIVLGIIIAGGFLIFFLGDLLMSIFNPKKDEKTIQAKKEKEVEKLKEEISTLSPESAKEVESIPAVAALLNEKAGVTVEAYNPEEEDKKEEAVEEVEEAPVEAAEAEETEEEDDEDERNAYIEARRRELMERLAMISQDEDEEEEEETEDSEDEEAEEETVDVDEIEEEDNEADEVLQAAIADAKAALEAERAKNQALLAEINAMKAEAASQDRGEEVFLSEEDYLARLAVEEDKLKLNEKELRACKKEFLPLRRVKKTLESDEKKLRRKEALVAKQKVVLYGVNNYSDIDEEKAKKLAEDLDHLDGLKLSVASCQEVMAKNAERYPLLEKMYDILTKQNEQIKANIERTEAELAKLKAKKDGTDGE